MLRNTCSSNVFAFGVVALRWELLFLQHNVYTHTHMREFVVDHEMFMAWMLARCRCKLSLCVFLQIVEGRHLSLHASTTLESETFLTTAKLTAEAQYST